jgi:hypothetical protein
MKIAFFYVGEFPGKSACVCVCVADFPHKEGVHRGKFGLDRLGFDNTLVK